MKYNLAFFLNAFWPDRNNVPYGKDSTVPLEDRILRYIDCDNPGSILFLGDSTLIRHSSDDTSPKGIDGFLAEISQKPIYPIAETAYNFEIFYGIIKYLSLRDRLPGTCILPINMRSFSPLWILNPSFSKVGVFEDLLNEKSLMPLLNEEEFFREIVDIVGLGKRRVSEYRLIAESRPKLNSLTRRRAELLFQFHYFFSMDIGENLLTRLSDTLTLLTEAGVKTIIYFTPLNMEAGKELIGESVCDAMNERINWIKENIVNLDKIDISDWTSACGSNCFFSRYIANEHLNERGRRKVASLLGDRLRFMK